MIRQAGWMTTYVLTCSLPVRSALIRGVFNAVALIGLSYALEVRVRIGYQRLLKAQEEKTTTPSARGVLTKGASVQGDAAGASTSPCGEAAEADGSAPAPAPAPRHASVDCAAHVSTTGGITSSHVPSVAPVPASSTPATNPQSTADKPGAAALLAHPSVPVKQNPPAVERTCRCVAPARMRPSLMRPHRCVTRRQTLVRSCSGLLLVV